MRGYGEAKPGVWESRYEYTSSSQLGTRTSEHRVRLQQRGPTLALTTEGVEDAANESSLDIRLKLAGNVATGTWTEITSPDGEYGGRTVGGVIQVVLHAGGKLLVGKWLGVGRSGEVNSGPWTFEYVGEEMPAERG